MYTKLARKKSLDNEVDTPQAGMLTLGGNLALNFHCAQKTSREPAAAMMADNEGRNIPMAASVSIIVAQHVAGTQEAGPPVHITLLAVAFAIRPPVHVNWAHVAFTAASQQVEGTHLSTPPGHIISLAATFAFWPIGHVASLQDASLPTDATVGAEMTTVGVATVTPIAFDSFTTAAAKAPWLACIVVALIGLVLGVRIS